MHWYYLSLVETFAEILPGRLTEELRGAVSGFAEAAAWDETSDPILEGPQIGAAST